MVLAEVHLEHRLTQLRAPGHLAHGVAIEGHLQAVPLRCKLPKGSPGMQACDLYHTRPLVQMSGGLWGQRRLACAGVRISDVLSRQHSCCRDVLSGKFVFFLAPNSPFCRKTADKSRVPWPQLTTCYSANITPVPDAAVIHWGGSFLRSYVFTQKKISLHGSTEAKAVSCSATFCWVDGYQSTAFTSPCKLHVRRQKGLGAARSPSEGPARAAATPGRGSPSGRAQRGQALTSPPPSSAKGSTPQGPSFNSSSNSSCSSSSNSDKQRLLLLLLQQ